MCGHPLERTKQRGSSEHIGSRCHPGLRLSCAAISLAIAVTACAGRTVDPDPVAARVIAEPWPEADARFRSDPEWLGGDGALSISLASDRTLWLFGDSFVVDRSLPPAERAGRTGTVMARNSIAIQHGVNLATSELRFYTRTDPSGRPLAFFAERAAKPDTWLWPGHGMASPQGVIVFMHRMQRDDGVGGLGFRPAGHVALSITNVEQPPPQWQLEPLALPELPGAGLVGVAVLRDGAHVYAFGVRDPGDRALTLVRWPAEPFMRGELAAAETWTGEERGFVSGGEAAALLAPVSTELSVTRDPRGEGHGFVLVSSQGFGIAPIELRFARALTGPWSAPSVVALEPYVEQGVPGMLVYAAKAHPEQQSRDALVQRDAEWVVTYAVNNLDATRLWQDLSIYYPRVLRVRRAPRRRVTNERQVLRSRASRCWPARVPARPARSRKTFAASA
jgi:hypothetical protein